MFAVLLWQVAFCAQKTIKFQVDKKYPPFSYEADGRVYGFTVDLANMIFEQDRYFLQISSDTWENVYRRLLSGEIDITGPVVILEERKKYILFSNPIFTRHVGIYTKKGFNRKIALDNLSSFKIGVLKADYTESLLSKKLGVKKYFAYPTVEDVLKALLAGKIDAAFTTQEVANYFITRNNYTDALELKVKDIFEVKSAFGISKKHPELVSYVNSRLKLLIKNGTFDQLYNNYFSVYSPYYYERQKNQIVLSILYVLIMVFFASSLTVLVMIRLNRRLRTDKEAFEKYAQLLASNANVIVLTLNLKGEIIYFNKFAEEITGYKAEEVTGKRWVDIFIPEYKREYIQKLFSKIAAEKVVNGHENEIITKNGDIRWILWNNTVVEHSYLNEPLIISTGLDITQQKKTQSLLEESYEEIEQTNQELVNALEILNRQTEILNAQQQRYKFIVDNISDSIMELDFKSREINFYGRQKDEFDVESINLKEDHISWLNLYHPEDRGKVLDRIQKALELKEENVEYEARVKDRSGNFRWIYTRLKIFYDANGKPEKIIGVNIDYTNKKLYEQRMEQLAYYDSLTGLANRKLFEQKLDDFIEEALKADKMGAVILIDIDNFKDINDLYGHEMGDEYLVSICKKIDEYLKTLSQKSFFARVGGDEFAIILDDLTRKDDVFMVCSDLKKIFEQEIYLEKAEREFFTTCSMGISFYPEDGTSTKEILRNVDMALSQAKENGKNDFQIFMPYMLTRNLKKIEIEKSLRKAIEDDQFVLYYQPVVDLDTLQITGVEALLRWISPQKGMISPLDFIPVAEESGLIVKIGELVIEKALKDIKVWEQKGAGNISVSINLSARQLRAKHFESKVLRLFEKYRIDPGKVIFEITESGAVENFDISLRILSFLCQMGIKFLIDDFGTGYSSLIYLRRLPIGGVKIDRSFISDIAYSKESRSIVEGIILMAHKLDLKVVAEGIETKEELDVLRQMGCDSGQGYLFSKPVPKDEIEKLILQGRILI
ncbi:EAL domain-containing protein [Caldicellulosiruptor morganii]|uniref:EAL domain-containing protein n=2 Tax=Caldicellulosiruptor morganii TaxID=1387555 RepID=A0ABY7BRC7_9FIRM|nr:EAL domain-containing protein [Caldicellulosiruptor morganii]